MLGETLTLQPQM